jgi:hypothetical protein
MTHKFALVPQEDGTQQFVVLEWGYPGPPPETLEQAEQLLSAMRASPEAKRAELVAAVQAHMDAVAQAWGYTNMVYAVSYADEPAVLQFQQEGMALRAWRSAVWGACYELLAQVQANTRAIPTVAELVAELPAVPVRPAMVG